MAKRLHKFYMVVYLTDVVNHFKSWVVNVNISDHMHICLKVEVDSFKVKYPFKFNHIRNTKEEFTSLVKNKWRELA